MYNYFREHPMIVFFLIYAFFLFLLFLIKINYSKRLSCFIFLFIILITSTNPSHEKFDFINENYFPKALLRFIRLRQEIGEENFIKRGQCASKI